MLALSTLRMVEIVVTGAPTQDDETPIEVLETSWAVRPCTHSGPDPPRGGAE